MIKNHSKTCEDLELENHLLHSIIDMVSDGVYAVSVDGTILFTSIFKFRVRLYHGFTIFFASEPKKCLALICKAFSIYQFFIYTNSAIAEFAGVALGSPYIKDVPL